MRFPRILATAALAGLFACALFGQQLPPLPVPAGVPDAIFYNGKVVTVNSAFAIQQAFAVKGDQFLAVGSNAAVRHLAGPKTRQIDLHGSTVIPGLMDGHDHQYNAAMSSRGVDVVGVSSLQEMLNRIRAAVAAAKPGQIVFTTSGYTVRPPPTREDLDQVSTSVPIVVPLPKQGDGVLNSAATKLLDAPPGLLTGAGQQRMPGSMVVLPKVVPEPTEAEEEALLLKVQQENNALGLTSIRDLNIYPNAMRAYYRLWRKGELTLRVGLGLMIVEPGDVEKSLSTWGLGAQFGDNWLRLDSISEEPHPSPGNKLQGTDFDQATQDEYVKAMRAMDQYGWRPAPHLSDDGSLELTLDAYEAVNRDSSIHEKRWVVEHIPTVKPDQIDRLEKLGVVVSAQFQPYNGGGAGMPDWGVPMRDMLDHHLIVGAGSDSHGLGQTDNPFVPFYFYVTRKTKDGKVVGLKEKISREEALRVSTINNAYLTFEEKVKGSIEPGKLADFVILNQDIMTVPDEQILSTHPLATYVGGREVFSSKGGGF